MQANAFAANYSAWRMCTIALALIGVLATQALAVANITDVNVVNKPDCVVVSVQGDAPLKMTAIQSTAGKYLGFQFAGKLIAKGRLVGIHSGRIFNVRYSPFQDSPPLARVVLNTASHLDYSTQWNDDKTRVDITVWKFGAGRSAASKPVPMAAPRPVAAKTEAALPVLPPAEISGPQGSEPGKAADPIPVKVKTEPMQIVRVASAAKPELLAQAVPASSGAGKRVSLNFLGADIADVLKAMSVQSGENIVVGSDVMGSITVTLDDVSVEEALDYITQLSGYHYIQDQHTYLVGSTGTVGGLIDAKVEIVTLSCANADDVLEMLKAQCPQIRTSKISVRGGTARVHKQELHQGNAKDSGPAGGATAPAAGAPGQAAAADGQPADAQAPAAAGSSPSKSIQEKKIQEVTESVAPQSEKNPTSNMIALVGSAEKVAAAKAFIDQIENAMRDQAADTKISAYSVKYVNTWELANTLMSLVLGVNVTIGPADESGPNSRQANVPLPNMRNVPANLLSGEDTHRPFVDPANTGAFTPYSQTLIIVGKAPDVQKALETAARFDVPGETELATYKTKYVDVVTLAGAVRKLVPGATVTGLEVPDEDAKGAPANAGQAGKPSQASGQGMEAATMSAAAANNLSRVIVITGRKGDVAKAKTIIEALDIKSPQIKIEAKITSLTQSGEKKLGLSWDWGKLSILEDRAAPTTINDPEQGTVAISKNVTVNRSLDRYFRQPLNFGATLEALITSGDGKLLAAPSLVCLEGKPGRFFVGDQIRFVTQISVAANGEPTVTTDTADVGVQLSVVGNVSSDGYITLNLHPEVSVVRLDQVQTAGLAMNLPTITRRYTDHVVRVKSGQTITIGGLINDQEVKEMTKVPLLGDLPILGSLFRHTRKTNDHSEVVIFINASVVDD